MKDIGTAILNVLAIVGLIVVVAFIIVFLVDLLMSIVDSKNGIFFKRKNEKEKVKELELGDELEQEKLPEPKQEKVEDKGDVDLELAESERLALLSEKTAGNEELEQRVAVLEQKANEAEEPEEKELTDEELDRMYAELLADINREDEEEVEQPETIEEVADEPVEEVEETVEVVDNSEAITSLEQQIEELRKQLAEQAAEKENLEKELENRMVVATDTVVETGSMEELVAQKEALEERLRLANKELKANKKEYIPLARIKKTLENDEAKLRRREAIVAKKKIMLFGVTNYVVDPEKEKELSEDLDQLEALRLSVEHCQEVMAENKDRYPLLENTNKILNTTVEQIKADLDNVNQKIANLQGNGNADNTTDNE